MAHTLYWFEGFETGEFTPSALLYSYNNATLSIESTITSFSLKSLKLVASNSAPYIMFNCDGLDSSGVWVDNNNPIDSTYCWHMYCSALPGSGQEFLIWAGTDAVIWRESAGILEDGKVRLHGEGTPGGTTATSTGAIQVNKWYVVTVIVVDHANFQVIIRDRDTGATVVDVSYANNGHPNRYVRIGCAFAGYGTFYFDNVVAEVSGTSVEDPVNLLTTKYAVGMKTPTGTGYYNTFSGSYTDVDDFPNDGDTTYRDGGAGAVFTQTGSPMANFAVGVGIVHAVMIKCFERATGANANQKMRLRSGSTDSDSSDVRDSDTAYRMEQKIWTLDPSGGAAWTASGADAAQFGMVVTDGTHRCTQISLQVLFSTAPIIRIPRFVYAIDAGHALQRMLDLRTGDVPDLAEVVEDAWSVIERIGLPTSESYESYIDRDDVLYHEEVTYMQGIGQETKLDIAPSTFNFVEAMVGRLSEPTAGI